MRKQPRTLVKASQSHNLTVHDHLIIGRHGYFSLAEQDMSWIEQLSGKHVDWQAIVQGQEARNRQGHG